MSKDLCSKQTLDTMSTWTEQVMNKPYMQQTIYMD